MKNIGYCIHAAECFPDKQLVDRFQSIPVPNIGDAMNRTACISSAIRAMNDCRLLGTAYTVRVPAGDNLLFYYAIDNAPAGSVIVVDGGGYTERALCGEIMATLAQKKGLVGFVINGAIRDPEEIAQMNFPVFACGVCPNGPYKNGPGEINIPVNLGGKVVKPGDILVGDRGGLVCFHPEDAEWILEKATAVQQKEAKMLADIESAGSLDLAWVYEKLEIGGCEM